MAPENLEFFLCCRSSFDLFALLVRLSSTIWADPIPFPFAAVEHSSHKTHTQYIRSHHSAKNILDPDHSLCPASSNLNRHPSLTSSSQDKPASSISNHITHTLIDPATSETNMYSPNINMETILSKLPRSLSPIRWAAEKPTEEQQRHRKYEEERKRQNSVEKVHALLWRNGETCMIREDE